MASSSSPYTQQRQAEFRGPSDSSSYNQRVAENYNDLVTLYNRVNLAEQQMAEAYGRFSKDQVGIVQLLGDLETRVTALEAGTTKLVFSDQSKIDTARFNGTAYSIPIASQLTADSLHGLLTLPQVASSTLSKLAFLDPTSGMVSIPSTLGTAVAGVIGTADDPSTASISTSPPELSMERGVGRIWQRNVLQGQPNSQGAQMALYIQCPQDIFTTANSNTFIIHPFPALGTTINEIAYTTNISPAMNDADGYQTFPAMYVDNPNAVGWVPPGTFGDGSDVYANAGFAAYYFDPVPITGLRIKFQQNNYSQENGYYIYSYGASLIDLRMTKFLSSGSAIVRFDAPAGKTISNVTSVQPQIFNVLEALVPQVFSYQAIWETAYNSGTYTKTPVAFSQRVWIQINLSATPSGGTPALNGLSITYN